MTTKLSPNAQLVSAIFEEVAKGNGAPFWDACHDDVVWRTIGEGSWSGEFVGTQTIIDEIFRPLNRVLVERATIPTRVIDGGDVIVVQAYGKNLTVSRTLYNAGNTLRGWRDAYEFCHSPDVFKNVDVKIDALLRGYLSRFNHAFERAGRNEARLLVGIPILAAPLPWEP